MISSPFMRNVFVITDTDGKAKELLVRNVLRELYVERTFKVDDYDSFESCAMEAKRFRDVWKSTRGIAAAQKIVLPPQPESPAVEAAINDVATVMRRVRASMERDKEQPDKNLYGWIMPTKCVGML